MDKRKVILLRPEMSDIPEEDEKTTRSSRVSKLRELFQRDLSSPKMFHSIKGSSAQNATQTMNSSLKWKQYEERHRQRKKDRLMFLMREKIRNSTQVQKPPEISQEVLSRRNTSTSTNMKGTLIEFSGGTSDFQQKASVNTKDEETRFGLPKLVSSDLLQEEDFLRILPPLMTPPTFSFFGKKNEDKRDLVKEKESNNVFYESTVDSDQKKVRMSMINGHDFNKKNKIQKDQSVNAKTRIPNGCQCKMQTLPTGVQTVDFTPFLVQLLESCLKVPHMLQNIRNVNNTFVSDLKSWRHYSKNLVNKVLDKNVKSPSDSTSKLDDRETCETCNECHSILEKLMNLLNETKIKPCKNTLYPDGILCRRCGCDFQRDAKPFVPCGCKKIEGEPEIKREEVPHGKSVQISEIPLTRKPSEQSKTDSAHKMRRSSKYSGSIVSYHAQCCGPKYPIKNAQFRPIRNSYLQTPRCIQEMTDDETDSSSCCPSCSTCRSYSK